MVSWANLWSNAQLNLLNLRCTIVLRTEHGITGQGKFGLLDFPCTHFCSRIVFLSNEWRRCRWTAGESDAGQNHPIIAYFNRRLLLKLCKIPTSVTFKESEWQFSGNPHHNHTPIESSHPSLAISSCSSCWELILLHQVCRPTESQFLFICTYASKDKMNFYFFA